MTDEPIVDLDRVPYLRDLETELVAAAQRTVRPPDAAPTSRPRGAFLAAAALIVVALVAGLLQGRARPAAALQIDVTGQEVTIRVVDADAKPDRIVAELEAAGIPAAIVRAAAPPNIDGRLVAVEVNGSGTAEADDLDGDGVVDQIVLARGFTGTLEIVIADTDADPSSAISAAGPPEGCELLIDRPVAEVATRLDDLADRIVWARVVAVDDRVRHDRVAGRAEVPDDDVVVELLVDAAGTLWATTTPTADQISYPPGSRCG
ncbi:MAG: hypothetical protein AAGA17_19975 [Actinomycetota bacterium]